MKSFLIKFILLFVFFQSPGISAQKVTGKWYSIDPDGQKETIIELYKKEGKLFGKIVALLQEEDRQKTCRKCPEQYKDLPLLGLEILRDFQFEDDSWTNGVILVPKNGREYKCNISLDEDKRLVIRGYVGFSLLGRSTYWYRVEKS